MIDIANKFDLLKEKFGRRLTHLREERNLSVLILAEACGLFRLQLYRLEAGKDNIEFRTLIKLAIGLQVKLVTLFDLEGVRPRQENKMSGLDERLRIEKQQFAQRLCKILKQRGIKRKHLAVLANIFESEITKITKAKSNFKFMQIARLATALDVQAVDLFDFEGPMPDTTTSQPAAQTQVRAK